MGNVAGYRQGWIDAEAYRRSWDEYWAEPTEKTPPKRDLALETLTEVLRGNILVQNHCYRADEMMQMIDIAKEFGYSIRSFHHGVEAYKIADVLAAEGIAGSLWADWGGFKMEALDGIPANIALVDHAGARAITHSDDESFAQRLNQETAKALAAGRAAGLDISEDHAVEWMTINPAWALGLDDRIGSIEVGKNADVVLWSGNPFSIYTHAEKVWVDGAMLYDRDDPAATMADRLRAWLRHDDRRGQLMRAIRLGASALLLGLSVTAAQAQTIAITGGTVYPVSGPKIPGGTVVIVDGKIAAVGTSVTVPAGATVIDATGKWITPGLVNASSDLGLTEVGSGASANETSADGFDEVSASFQPWLAYNPQSVLIPDNREHGVTSVVVWPNGNLIAGQGAAIDLGAGSLDECAGQGTGRDVRPAGGQPERRGRRTR